MLLRARQVPAAARQLGLLVLLASGLFLLSPTAAASGGSLERWCRGYLTYLGAPARSDADPRVAFLERWATLEGSYFLGNGDNPLDTERRARGALLWNQAGVRRYRTLRQGFQATLATMEQPFNHPILSALRDRRATYGRLALVLAESNWTGYGQRSWVEQGYASRVSGRPMRSFGLKEPTMAISGRLVDPLGRGLPSVCVTAFPARGAPIGVLSGAGGTFRLGGLPRAPYRLEIVDCHHDAGAPRPLYYQARGPGRTTAAGTRATVLGSSCSEERPCPSLRDQLPGPITFGVLTPMLSWPAPGAVTFGARLGPAELDARASAGGAPVAGRFSYWPPPGTRLTAGERELQVRFLPRDRRGFATATGTVQLRVRRALPTVTWQEPAPVAAGTRLSSVQLDARASVPGRFTYAPGPGAVLPAGRQRITVTFRPRNSQDFAITITSVPVLVEGATPQVVWAAPAPIAAGTPLSSAQLDATASVAGSFVYSPPPGTVLPPGTHQLVATFTPADSGAYASVTARVSVTVGPGS